MPRRRRKNKGDGNQVPSPEEDLESDVASVYSRCSETDSTNGGTIDDAANGEDHDVIAEAGVEIEDNLLSSIDRLSHKSSQIRIEGLKDLGRSLSMKYLSETCVQRKSTIEYALERCLKRGQVVEQTHAANAAAILAVSFGIEDGAELLKSLRLPLYTLLHDAAAGPEARRACAEAIGIMEFLASEEATEITDALDRLQQIFKASFFKGDGTAPHHTPNTAAMHTAALNSWNLLLTVASPRVVQAFVASHLIKLVQVLHSNDGDLRIAAGEGIALCFELARHESEHCVRRNNSELREVLRQLATDCSRHKSKRERRTQRSSFRDILATVEADSEVFECIQFGEEKLTINSWKTKCQYNAFCGLLGSGVYHHLQENELLRDVFGLGCVIVKKQGNVKRNRSEKHMHYVQASKIRTKHRSKVRDKRTVSLFSDT